MKESSNFGGHSWQGPKQSEQLQGGDVIKRAWINFKE